MCIALQLIEATGASVTNKGIYYDHGKEPPVDGPPKLHLLVESNDEYRVRFSLSFDRNHDIKHSIG